MGIVAILVKQPNTNIIFILFYLPNTPYERIMTLAMGKYLWFSVKNKSLSIVPFFTVKLPWPEYFMAVKSIFDIKHFKDVKFWVEQSVLH